LRYPRRGDLSLSLRPYPLIQAGPLCAALTIGRSMNLGKLDSLRYAFCDPDFF
jgi:hypothetical protein